MNHLQLANQILQDNPVLYDKIKKTTNLEREKVEALLTETLRFMHLTTIANERLTPSHLTDLAWHEFILFTKYYAAFCEEYMGRFVHHYPGGSEAENRECFRKTHYHYYKTFGEKPPTQFWGKVLIEIADASDCGLCSS